VSTTSAAGGFTWLHPGSLPTGWRTLAIPGGATLPVPPGWHRTGGDRGTATAILGPNTDAVTGYLNLTPKQGGETLANWTRFRLEHNAAEGDRNVVRLAGASGLRFRAGTGSCVRDRYLSGTGRPYVEIACLIAGRHTSTVIVGASPPAAWARISPALEQAISSVTT
jgi:hypothetical protein